MCISSWVLGLCSHPDGPLADDSEGDEATVGLADSALQLQEEIGAMQAERSLARAAMLAAMQQERVFGYQGPMTQDAVVQSHKHWVDRAAHDHRAAAAAPDSGTTMVLHCFFSMPVGFPRQHALSDFSLEALMLGKDGSRLRENIER